MNIQVLRRGSGDSPVCANPAESFTLPARFYTDPAVYEAEKAAIFYKSWWCAGHKSQLPRPGSYLTTEIFEQSVIVTRSHDGGLRAYYNVCQHRGHELVKGTGEAKMFVCPYHAWTYNLDGSLRTARLTKAMPNFKACDFALKSVRVEDFCGFIFVNLDPGAASLKEQTGSMEDEIRRYVPRIDEPNISALMMVPAGPDRTIEHLDWFLPTTEISQQIRDAMTYMDATLQPEDISLCESVQKGLKSRGYNQGRFVIDPDHPQLSEHGVHHFQKLVANALNAELG